MPYSDPLKAKQFARAWQRKNRAKLIAYRQEYYQRNKKRLDAKHREWLKGNRERHADYMRKSRMGITRPEYDTMLKAQGGACAICGVRSKKPRLTVDHCHKTGGIRGLLCHMCNSGLGLLGDTVERMTSALAYLRRNK